MQSGVPLWSFVARVCLFGGRRGGSHYKTWGLCIGNDCMFIISKSSLCCDLCSMAYAPRGHFHGHKRIDMEMACAHGICQRNKHGCITHDTEILLTFCSAKNAYHFLHCKFLSAKCKIGVSPHIKVDICHFLMQILWQFCGNVRL